MVIYAQGPQILEKDKILIAGCDETEFWHHHTWSQEQFNFFEKYAHMYPTVFEKVNSCEDFTYQDFEALSENEKIAYKCYFDDPINIQYDSENDRYEVLDGRHRVAILIEAGVELKFNVNYILEFAQIQDVSDLSMRFCAGGTWSLDGRNNTVDDINISSTYKDILYNVAVLDTEENRYWVHQYGIQFIQGQSSYPDIANSYLLLKTNPNEWYELSQNIPPDNILVLGER